MGAPADVHDLRARRLLRQLPPPAGHRPLPRRAPPHPVLRARRTGGTAMSTTSCSPSRARHSSLTRERRPGHRRPRVPSGCSADRRVCRTRWERRVWVRDRCSPRRGHPLTGRRRRDRVPDALQGGADPTPKRAVVSRGSCRGWVERSRPRFVLTERGLPSFRAPTLRPNRPVSHGPGCFFEYGMA